MAQFIIDVDVRGEQALKKLGIQVGQVEKKGISLSSTFKKLGGALAIFYAGSKLLSGIKSTIDSMDKLNKTALKLGTTTEQLSSLGFAAERSGIEVRTFELAMQRMTRRVSEAATGTGEAKTAIAELGIEADKLNNLSLEDKMAVLADAFQGVTSESDKLRLAFKLFDSEGAQLVTLLSAGSDGLRELQKVSDATGNTLKQSVADQASAAADSLSNFVAATKGITNFLATTFLPVINQALNGLLDFFNIPRETNLRELEDNVTRLTVKLEGFLKIGSKRSSSENGVSERAEAIREELELATKALDDYKESLTKGGDAGAGFTSRIESLYDALVRIKTAYNPVSEAVKQYKLDLESLDLGLKKGIITTEEYAVALQNMKNALSTVANSTSKVQEELKSMEDTVGNGLGAAFRQSMDGAQDWGDALGGILKDLLAQFFQVYVIKKLIDGIDLSGTASVTTPSTKLLSGARANGGSVLGGSTYLVGERGPELFTPSGSGAITSNGNMGGGETNIVVNNYSKSEVTTQTDDQGNIEIIINEIANQITRGVGSIGTSLERRYALQKV